MSPQDAHAGRLLLGLLGLLLLVQHLLVQDQLNVLLSERIHNRVKRSSVDVSAPSRGANTHSESLLPLGPTLLPQPEMTSTARVEGTQ